jgi:hypothetical protein
MSITMDILETSKTLATNGKIEQMKYQMFMAHIPVRDISSVVQTLLSYNIGQYLVCGETTPYDHLHFMVEMSDETYHKFSKRVFKDKYKLRGRAMKGKSRQYGKQKKIKDLEKALAYTCKMYKQHKELCRTNMTEETLMKYVEISYIKKEEKKPHEVYIEKLSQMKPTEGETTRKLILLWMELCPNTRPPLFRSLLWYAYQSKYITQDQFISDYYTESRFGFSQIGSYGTPYESDEEPNTIGNYLVEYDSEA